MTPVVSYALNKVLTAVARQHTTTTWPVTR
jgi:hypothetical protein